MNLNAPTYVKTPSAIERQVNRYLDTLKSFEGDARGSVQIDVDDIGDRILRLAVPSNSLMDQGMVERLTQRPWTRG